MNMISYMICVCSKFTSMFLGESFSPVDIRPRSASDKRPSFTLFGCGSSNTDVFGALRVGKEIQLRQ